MIIKKINYQRVLLACLFILAGALGRILLRDFLPGLPHWSMTIYGITQPVFILDMFFVVGIFSLLSGLVIGGYYSFIVPIGIMVLTDIYYGNTFIFLFTWSGFALMGLLGYFARSKISVNIKSIFPVMGIGIGGILIYDFWTNFGCWLGWYPHTLDGLLSCYVLALPFTFWHLLSMSLILPISWILIVLTKKHTFNVRQYVVAPLEKYITFATFAFLGITSFVLLL